MVSYFFKTNEIQEDFLFDFSQNPRIILLRGRAVAARRAHNPEVAGSNPVPATGPNGQAKAHQADALFCCLFAYVTETFQRII